MNREMLRGLAKDFLVKIEEEDLKGYSLITLVVGNSEEMVALEEIRSEGSGNSVDALYEVAIEVIRYFLDRVGWQNPKEDKTSMRLDGYIYYLVAEKDPKGDRNSNN